MKLSNGNYLRTHKRYSWWLGQSNYFQYMMRELSSLFIGAFTLTLIWGVFRFSQGPEAYQLWLMNLWDNLFAYSLICFIFATYHSITWFWVTPKAMPIAIGGKPLPGSVIIGAHIAAWLIISLAGWFITTGGA
jgi:fumarate reductase subunit C